MTRSTNTSLQLVIEVGGSTPPPKSDLTFATFAPGLLTAAFVVIGWIVVERFARARERRADMRELSKIFSSAVDDVVATAHEFYLLSGRHQRASALATLIRAKLGALPRLLEAIRETGFDIEANDQLRHFRQSVTGGTFDQSDRIASVPDAAIFPEITAAGRSLAAEVQIALIRKMSGPSRRKQALLPLAGRFSRATQRGLKRK